MTLNQYHKKRDFAKTPEPKGTTAQSTDHLFIVQKHAASHLHYDFRLELDGVLKSWAVPKGPSLDSHVKRLAMHVEDHPVAYGNFEGIIPKGQYGGGTVMLWDKGTWEPLDENPYLAYEKGHLRFRLTAEKLNGRWDLIRFKDEKHWFLIKFQDEYAQDETTYDITESLCQSVLSHQTMDEITAHYQHIWTKDGLKKAKPNKTIKKPVILLPKDLQPSPFPDFISPQLATLVDKVPETNQWIHEIKFDGYRILAFKKDNDVVLKSRNNNDWTAKFPTIAMAVNKLPINNLILDGEIVVLDKQGKSNFQLLQNAIHNKQQANFKYFLFDILYIDQFSLKKLPLIERKSVLQDILRNDSDPLIYSNHMINQGKEMFEHSCRFALEGIVSKRMESPYQSKRSKDWLKIKCLKRQEFVIGGYTHPKGERLYLGALLLGVYNQQGLLDYVGNVGTGFTNTSLKEIHSQLLENTSDINPFSSNPPGYSQINWLKPNLVAEVEFTGWTTDSRLRHPSFKGLRVDKKATEVIREHETTLEDEKIKKIKNNTSKKFIISHPSKILYPEDKITKQDLLAYYETVSDYILPFIASRPLSLVRCPSDYNKCFYQRHFNKTLPEALHSIAIKTDKETEQYIYLNDREGLLNLVQMDVLEIHPWGSTIDHIESPDILVFDLDPGPDVPWRDIVAGAFEVRHHLAQYHLKSFVKSTGGKGLHVVVPILPEYSWEEIKEFTHVFVLFLEKLKPDKYISTMSKAKRKGKIFIDYLRNQRTATAIGAYSTRSRIHAPVSTPLSWEELNDKIEDNTYTIKTLPKRLNALKKDPWYDFWDIKQSLKLDELNK